MPRGAQARLPRRATDRVEDLAAWVLSAALLVVAVAAVVAGLSVHDTAAARARDETANRVCVTAVLTADAPVVAGSEPADIRVLVPAEWLDPAGTRHTGTVDALEGTPAGTRLPVWLDRSGAVVAPPLSPTGVGLAGFLAGGIVLVSGGLVLLVLWLLLRHVTALCNAEAWEREWARVGPAWRRGDPHPDAGSDRPRAG
jgi:hypothetical protein